MLPEPIFNAAVEHLTGIIFKTFQENGKKLVDNFQNGLAQKQYTQRYTERNGILKVLGMSEPVDLESVFTTVQLKDNLNRNIFQSTDTLGTALEGRKRGFQIGVSPKKEGIAVANEKQYLIILGGPGAGKSTFLRRIGLEALKGQQGKFKHEVIPVLVELKNFDESKIIEELIADEFEVCGFPSPKQFTEDFLKQGNLLVLLDGLDEVNPNNLNDAINQIEKFADKYHKNRFIVSCRGAAYRGNLRRFTDVELADFSDEQIKQFIDKWFQSELDKQIGTSRKLWEILQKTEHIAAKELAQTPLFLTYICLVYNRTQKLPDNRSSLYSKALRILLEEWAAEKRIYRDEIYEGLNTELEEDLLSEIAYDWFESNQLFFHKREIVQQIKKFLAENLNAPRYLNGEKILDTIAIQQGILVERAADIFSFSHLTLQEYLTAKYIADNSEIENLVVEYLINERWQEIFLLVAGLKKADDLLKLMQREAQNYISTPKVQALLNWLNQATINSQANMKPALKRNAALFFALSCELNIDDNNPRYRALKLACDLCRELDPALAREFESERSLYSQLVESFESVQKLNLILDLDLNRANILKKIKIFADIHSHKLVACLEEKKKQVTSRNQSRQTIREFRTYIQQVWLNALEINQELIDFSAEDTQAIINYLYANWLLVRCKKAAVRVSPQTWSAIESQMFLPNSNF